MDLEDYNPKSGSHSRINIPGRPIKVQITRDGSAPQNNSLEYTAVTGEMYSHSHPTPPGRYPNSGGSWWQSKTEVDYAPCYFNNLKGAAGSRLSGAVVPTSLPGVVYKHPVPSEDTNLQLLALGATGIANTLPNIPSFDALTALGEIGSEGVPGIPGIHMRERVSLARRLGSGYLTHAFGWAPLLRDVQQFAEAVVHADEILKNYRHLQRRNIRVRYEFPTATQTSTAIGALGLTPSTNSVVGASGSATFTTTKKTWFEGCYWYHLPVGDTPSSKSSLYAAEARKLLNTSVTPEVLWNVAPWSWAADWAGNIGDVMSNVSHLGRDGLVLRYGYLMQEIKSVETISGVCTAGSSPKLEIGNARRTVASVVRKRIAASPYGFGVTYDGLSPSQVAVLAALGLSKS
jgi:hypothetical protein